MERDQARGGFARVTLNVVCTFVDTQAGKTICTAAASLSGGRITASGLIPNGPKFTLPIVGGTGSYAGAKGYVEVTNNIGGKDTNKSNDKFVITGLQTYNAPGAQGWAPVFLAPFLRQ